MDLTASDEDKEGKTDLQQNPEGVAPQKNENDTKNESSPTLETTEPRDSGAVGKLGGGDQSEEEKAPEMDRKDNQVDEPEPGADEETLHKTPDTNTEAEKNNESDTEETSAPSKNKTSPTLETTDSTHSGVIGKSGDNESSSKKVLAPQKMDHCMSPTTETTEPTDPWDIGKSRDNESSPKKVLAPRKMDHCMSENKTSPPRETTEPTDPWDIGKLQDHESSPRKVQAPQMNEDDMREDESLPTLEHKEASDVEVIEKSQGNRRFLIVGVVVALVGAILVQHFLKPEPPSQKSDVQQIDIFLKEMEKVKSRFPNQRVELWNRSKIHMLRHLQTAQPTEPVSLILTAGAKAEKTLHCMAQGLASALSSALNASVLHIDGTSKTSQDSDQVKLEIDRKLQRAFEGDKPVAVIHRFEKLPPGSTLIFYRYCDHENAAYKKTGLIFTVLLEDVGEITASSLSTVEEMVDDHLKKKFLSHDYPVSFDRMDLDKYSGLWSRISHLILPVAAEEKMERKGC